jgi:hypothetical protein
MSVKHVQQVLQVRLVLLSVQLLLPAQDTIYLLVPTLLYHVQLEHTLTYQVEQIVHNANLVPSPHLVLQLRPQILVHVSLVLQGPSVLVEPASHQNARLEHLVFKVRRNAKHVGTEAIAHLVLVLKPPAQPAHIVSRLAAKHHVMLEPIIVTLVLHPV